jgi:isopentenyl phosphate kinase
MTDASRAERYDITVIKLGGSLITDKTRQGFVRDKDLADLGSLLARNINEMPGLVLLIMGGGAVGHFAAKQLGVERGVPHCDLAGLHKMAGGMYAFKNRLAERFESLGVPALAFQETSYLVARADGSIALYDSALRHAFSLGIVPIVSGGLVFDDIRGVRPLNGDLIPLALDTSVFNIKRVIMLTDVPGVLAGDGTVITTLDPISRARMARIEPVPGWVDTTGGMDIKVEVALTLARRGIPTVICSGRQLDDIRLRSIVSGTPGACTLAGFNGEAGFRSEPLRKGQNRNVREVELGGDPR